MRNHFHLGTWMLCFVAGIIQLVTTLCLRSSIHSGPRPEAFAGLLSALLTLGILWVAVSGLFLFANLLVSALKRCRARAMRAMDRDYQSSLAEQR